jgi:hypothetical protein
MQTMQDTLALMGLAASRYAFLLLLALVSYLLGALLVRREWYESRWEEVSHATALGLGLLTHGLFVLGSVGLLYRGAVAGVVALALGLGWRRWWPQAAGLLAEARRLRWAHALGALLVLGFAVPMLLLPLLPAIAWDGTEYYLRCAWLFVDQHRIVFTPHLRMAVYPHLNTMLFALGLLFSDDLGAQLTQLLALLVTAASLLGAGTRLFSARAGWWAAALLVGTPIALWLGTVAYIDMGLTLFLTVAALTFLRWLERQQLHWLLLSAAFFGFAASAKHNALPLFALCGAVVLFKSLAWRQVRPAVLFGLLGLVVAAPWYVRNAWYTGNPFFPLLPGLFGYSYLSVEDMQAMFENLNLTRRQGVRAVLELPWLLTFKPGLVRAEAPLSPGYLAALPFLLAGAWKDRWVRVLLAVFGLQAVLWFLSTQLIRHLTPSLPLLCLAVGGALHCVLPRKEGSGFILPRTGGVVLLALVLLIPSRNFARRRLRAEGLPPTTAEKREAFLAWALPTYPAYKLLNERKGHAYSLYALLDENMAYFAQGDFKGDHFGPARYRDLRASFHSGEALYQALRKLGADHFLVNFSRYSEPLPQDEFFHAHFKPILSHPSYRLYELLEQPRPLKTGLNLLYNPGFEELEQGRPKGWGQAGTPEVLMDPDGQHVVKATGESNVFHQEVSVQGGRGYRLSFRARSALGEPQKARLQVNWIDESRQFLPADTEMVRVGPEWKSYAVQLVAPTNAHRGSIPLTPHGDSEVLFDDVRFEPLLEQ